MEAKEIKQLILELETAIKSGQVELVQGVHALKSLKKQLQEVK